MVNSIYAVSVCYENVGSLVEDIATTIRNHCAKLTVFFLGVALSSTTLHGDNV